MSGELHGPLEALVEGLLRNDPVAWGTLRTRLSNLVMPRLRRAFGGDEHAAEDVFQDALIRLWRRLPQYDGSRPFLRWFWGILRKTTAEALRHDRRRAERLVKITRESTIEPVLRVLEAREILDRIGDPVDRAILFERYWERRTFVEIGQRLEMTANAVRMRHNRVCARLRRGRLV